MSPIDEIVKADVGMSRGYLFSFRMIIGYFGDFTYVKELEGGLEEDLVGADCEDICMFYNIYISNLLFHLKAPGLRTEFSFQIRVESQGRCQIILFLRRAINECWNRGSSGQYQGWISGCRL